VDKHRPRSIIKADMLRGNGGGLAVMKSVVRFHEAPLTANSKTYLVVPPPAVDHAAGAYPRDQASVSAYGTGA
jgi:hypothetical protein